MSQSINDKGQNLTDAAGRLKAGKNNNQQKLMVLAAVVVVLLEKLIMLWVLLIKLVMLYLISQLLEVQSEVLLKV